MRLGLHLSRTALTRLHVVSGGNPFYALELGRVNRTGGELVLPESLDDLVAGRLRALPADTRRSLAGLALAGRPLPGARLDEAARVGVVAGNGGTLRFTHPLLAEAAVALLDPDERRALHRDIAASTTNPEQHALHLARGTLAPDDGVASIAAAGAAAAGKRGTYAVAAELWDLAAGLTDPGNDRLRAERSAEAGLAHQLSGNPRVGAERLAQNLDRLPPGLLRHRGLIALALGRANEDLQAPIPILEQLLREADDLRLRGEVVNLLATFIHAIGDPERAADLAREYAGEAESEGGEALANALLISANHELFCERSPWALIERAQALRSREPAGAEGGPWKPAHFLGMAMLRDDRIDEARAAFENGLAELREQGSAGHYSGRLSSLGYVELAAGRWHVARSYGDELLSTAEQIESPLGMCDALCLAATAAALLGEVGEAKARATRAVELAERLHAVPTLTEARSILGLVEFSMGDAKAAAAQYRLVPTGAWRRWTPLAGARSTIDAVEAFVEMGDVDLARTVAATLPPDAAEVLVARALLHSANGDLNAAITTLRSATPPASPFRRARTLLLLGRWLRRARRRGESREVLQQARDEFVRLGARLWVERAEGELARLGRRGSSDVLLTESEWRIAELVASGLSNKEIAARMVIAVRTVEAHLSHVYAKLDVGSRTALAARWPELRAAAGAPPATDGAGKIVDFRDSRRRREVPRLDSETA